MFLSITLETYNQAHVIEQTINSIINQCKNIDYELIIGDDCSKDDTPKILDMYAEKYSQIKIIHNPVNLGPMGNFYNIVNKISGKYWMDCAGDDLWIDNKIKTQLLFLEENPNYGMCCGYARQMIGNQNTKIRLGQPKVSFEEILNENNIIAATCCIRVDLLKQYLKDVKPHTRNWLMEDYPMWIWFSKNSKIKFIEEDFAYYRMLSESVSHSSNIEKEINFIKNVYLIRKFFIEKYEINQNITEDLYLDLFYSHYKKYLDYKDHIFINNMKSFYPQIINKSKKVKIIYFLCNIPWTLILLDKIRK